MANTENSRNTRALTQLPFVVELLFPLFPLLPLFLADICLLVCARMMVMVMAAGDGMMMDYNYYWPLPSIAADLGWPEVMGQGVHAQS